MNQRKSSFIDVLKETVTRIGHLIATALIIAGRFLAKVFRSIGRRFTRFFSFLTGIFKNPVIQAESTKKIKPVPIESESDSNPDEMRFREMVRPGATESDTVVIAGKHSKNDVYPGIPADHLLSGAHEHVSIFKPRERRPNFAIGVILTTVKMLLLVVFMFGAGVIGLLWGIAKAYMETTPTLDVQKIENQSVNSYIYDANDQLITVFTGTENREWAYLKDIPLNLQNAFISVEDIRFRYHNGIDVKRIFGVFINNILNENIQGGSTITQQLIKNRLLTTEQTYKRKIQEAYLAMQLEKTYKKEDILEGYLNTIPLGGTNYGVKAAAKDYFGKDLKDLSLRECACLAGMNQAPYKYNPRRVYYVTKKPEPLNDRVDFVLKKMYEADYITKEQYEAALKDKLVITEKSAVNELYSYPYFVEYAVNDVITHLLRKRNMQDTKANRVATENEIRSNGYKIYTTLDPKIQETVQNTLANWKNYPKLANGNDAIIRQTNADSSVSEVVQPQAAAVIYDYRFGELKAIVGGRNAPNVKKALNRAYQTSMPVGSSIKPIAVYAPAIDKGASPATPVANVPVKIPGWNTKQGYPATSSKTYGPVTLRRGLVSSLNTATARALMDYVGINDSKNYLVSLGVNPEHINADGPGLALGTSGITPVEMAVAYGAVANKGQYMEAFSFRKVLDKDGNVILDADKIRVERQVFKPSTAWFITDMLTDAVDHGTGTRAQIKGMTVGGKTGTNQDNRGVFFSGITPYYAATVWIGHDNYKPLTGSIAASSTAAPLWQKFMSEVHKGLKNKKIIEDTPESLGLVKATICSVSGLKATDACKLDIDGHKPITDWFLKSTVPKQTCDWHYVFEACTETNLLTTEFCPTKKNVAFVFPPGSSPLSAWNKLNKGIKIPANTDPSEITADNTLFAKLFCGLHTEEWYNDFIARPGAISDAKEVIADVKYNLTVYILLLTPEHKAALESSIDELQSLIDNSVSTASEITAKTEELKQTADAIFSMY